MLSLDACICFVGQLQTKPSLLCNVVHNSDKWLPLKVSFTRLHINLINILKEILALKINNSSLGCKVPNDGNLFDDWVHTLGIYTGYILKVKPEYMMTHLWALTVCSRGSRCFCR